MTEQKIRTEHPSTCDPVEVALKGYFLGPQAENGPWLKETVTGILSSWFRWRISRFPSDGSAVSAEDQRLPEFLERRQRFEASIQELLLRFESEVPKFSPRYIGHMFSELSLPALIGHWIALLHNPNNISGESARVGVRIEAEAIRALLSMVGYPPESAQGHFTSGGTVANLEALLRARARLSGDRPGDPAVLVPANRHYSWNKAVNVLGLPASSLRLLRLDSRGRVSVDDLRRQIEVCRSEGRPILMVVTVAGSTELGSVDPIDEVTALLDEYAKRGIRLWHHVDAAYGGFLAPAASHPGAFDPETRRAILALGKSDSLTLDPHKLGYVPYSCGALLVRRREDYLLPTYDTPYIQFDPDRDRGPFTLEGSRPATGAAAVWMTDRAIGLDAGGIGRVIGRTVLLRRKLEEALRESGLPIRVAPHAQSNILAFCVSEKGNSLREVNRRTDALALAIGGDASGFQVSRTRLGFRDYERYLGEFVRSWNGELDDDGLSLVRICLMNPFFGSKEMRADYPRELIQVISRLLTEAQ